MSDPRTLERLARKATSEEYDRMKGRSCSCGIYHNGSEIPEKVREKLRESILDGATGFGASAIPYVLEQVLEEKQPSQGWFYHFGCYQWPPSSLTPAIEESEWAHRGAIVVQNLSIEWIVTLTSRFNVPLDFFRRHCAKDFWAFDKDVRKPLEPHVDFHVYQTEDEAWDMSQEESVDRELRHGYRVSCWPIRVGLREYLL